MEHRHLLPPLTSALELDVPILPLQVEISEIDMGLAGPECLGVVVREGTATWSSPPGGRLGSVCLMLLLMLFYGAPGRHL